MAQDFLENSYLFGANAAFIEELYARYVSNPASVDASWQRFFSSLGDKPAHAVSWNQAPLGVIGQPDPEAPAKPAADKAGKGTPAAAPSTAQIQEEALRALQAQQLIRAYRVRGHLLATLDPLGIEQPKMHADLDPKTYGFGDADMDRSIYLGGNLGRERATLREIVSILQATYSGSYGSLMSTPIVNPPQSAILGMHKTEERPVVVKGEIVIRPMMYVAMSYDHRIIDGAESVTFLVKVKQAVEDPRRLLLGL
jgi:2-oxoglutarate dehydrogenase E1 component